MFQTVGNPVSETAAYGIVTRATRVWRVQQVVLDEKGDPKQGAGGSAVLFPETLVLKDTWLNDDARLESEISSRGWAPRRGMRNATFWTLNTAML